MARTKSKRKSSQARVQSVPRKNTPLRLPVPTLRGKDLETVVKRFQSEPDDKKAHEDWKRIENSVFGVQFED